MYLKDGSMLSFYLLPFGYSYDRFSVFEKIYSRDNYYVDGSTLHFPGLGIGFIPANGYVKREPLPMYGKKFTSRSNETVYAVDLDKDWNLGSPYVTNAVKDIVCINDNTFALSLGNIYYTEKDYYSPGIIILTKTMKDKIAIIMPSASAETDDIVKIAGFDDVYRNSLVAATYESKFAPYRYDTIPFKSTFGDKTILNPIIIQGTDDYCPDCFYVPVSQYILPKNEDTVLNINGEPYYYNGFIAVKLY